MVNTMNPMQRRDFLRTALASAGAAGSLAIPAVHAARRAEAQPTLHALLARAEGQGGDTVRWRPLDQCGSEACAASTRVRISIDRLQFPAGFGALAVDAMFATAHGIRPFRMATYQPDSLSPASKPFAFEVDAVGLAGFRAEHADVSGEALAVASSPLLGVARPALAGGRYLLVLARDGDRFDVDSIAVSAHPADAVLAGDGNAPAFACIAFSVHRLA